MTLATAAPIHPTHLEDLRKSGLTDATIAHAGLYTATSEILRRLAGLRVPDGTSGLVFPYGSDFSRVKFFPPIPGRDGKPIKYGQPARSGVRAYIPQDVVRLLDEADVPLFITEGEKKALKLTQEGFSAVGLGGIWNFRTHEMPANQLIADLELIAWKDRIVRIVPDSDAWVKDQALCAIYVLARLLEARGATVLIVKLPTLDGHDKTGSDDFLVAKGTQAFRRLVDRAVTLGHPAFKAWREQEKRAEREARTQGAEPIVAETIPWDEPVDGAALLAEIEAVLAAYVVLPTRHAATAISLWALAGHALDAFSIFPMLGVTSPTPRCGKTTLLSLLQAMTPRPLPSSNISAPAVFRTIEALSPTLLLDEADTYCRENEEMRGVVNSGHARGTAFVIRMVGEGRAMEPKRFSTWCPKIVALIGKLSGTWEDRSIVVAMQRKRKTDRVQRLRRKALAPLADLGRKAARWAKDHLADLAEAEPALLDDLDDRANDNWEPLFAIADLLQGPWPARVRQAARALSAGRDAENEGLSIRLLRDIREVFDERQGEAAERISSAELVDQLLLDKEAGGGGAFKGRPLTQRSLARTLRGFGIKPKTFADNKNRTSWRGYERAAFRDAWERYLEPKGAKYANESNGLGMDSDPKCEEEDLGCEPDITPEEQKDILDILDTTLPTGGGTKAAASEVSLAQEAGLLLLGDNATFPEPETAAEELDDSWPAEFTVARDPALVGADDGNGNGCRGDNDWHDGADTLPDSELWAKLLLVEPEPLGWRQEPSA